MIAISIMIEGQDGLTWPRWKRIAGAVEQLGFAGLFRSDHFTNAEPPARDSLEMLVSLAYLADRSERIHFGPLVAPVSMRDPIMLTRQAAALHDLSGGRFWLGLGAGWQEREHRLFGYELGDIPTRMDRLAEALEVATLLLHSEEPVSFSGRFYQLRGATLLPRPKPAGGPPILVGGNGERRTLPLVARYADIWNGGFLMPEAFRARSAQLDGLLQAAGRQPRDVRRTMMTELVFSHDQAVLERRLRAHIQAPASGGSSIGELVATVRGQRALIAGTADDVIAQIRDYAAAGVEELMLQWYEVDDVNGLRAFADRVLPYVS